MHRRNALLITLCCLFGSFEWGCSSQTRRSKADIESRLKDILKLKDIHLTEGAKGSYEGTGTNENGTTYTIKATQNNNQVQWKSENSKTGIGTGNFHF